MDRHDLRHDLEERARDAAYVAIGFCVLGVQQLQVRRRELTADLTARATQAADAGKKASAPVAGRVPNLRDGLGSVPGAVTSAARGAAARVDIKGIVRQAEAMTDPVLDGVERVLPGTARAAMQQGRSAAKVVRKILL